MHYKYNLSKNYKTEVIQLEALTLVNYFEANGKIDATNSASINEIFQENHYYAFGERASSSHNQWLVGEVKRSIRPAVKRGANCEVKTFWMQTKVLLRTNHEGPWLMNNAAKDNAYQYNGKELNVDHGLNWSDYGARWYDACIGRFSTVDPLAHKTPNMSTYNYVNNNPLINIDPTGGFAISVHYMMTQSALKKLGYSSRASDLIGHYASTYADNPAGHMGNAGFIMARQQGQPYRKGINYSGTNDSQNTAAISTSTWHSMRADNENISNQKAKERGQSYGWGKIFEAGAAAKAAGGIENLGQNSKGIQALGQGIHALQDAVAHKGTDMANHSVPNDMSPSPRDFSTAFGITESAIVLTEVMSGNFNNLGNGMSLNFEGMSSSQLKTAISGLLKGMEANNIGYINIQLGKKEQVITR